MIYTFYTTCTFFALIRWAKNEARRLATVRTVVARGTCECAKRHFPECLQTTLAMHTVESRSQKISVLTLLWLYGDGFLSQIGWGAPLILRLMWPPNFVSKCQTRLPEHNLHYIRIKHRYYGDGSHARIAWECAFNTPQNFVSKCQNRLPEHKLHVQTLHAALREMALWRRVPCTEWMRVCL